MSVRVEFKDPNDLSRIVDALHTAAETEAVGHPTLANRYIRIANYLGDAMQNQLPDPPAHPPRRVGWYLDEPAKA